MAKEVQKSISCYDVRECLSSSEDMQDDIKVREVLYGLGLDVYKKLKHEGKCFDGYYIEECVHRTIRNEIKGGFLFRGVERLDQGWLQSGFATKEATSYSESKNKNIKIF